MESECEEDSTDKQVTQIQPRVWSRTVASWASRLGISLAVDARGGRMSLATEGSSQIKTTDTAGLWPSHCNPLPPGQHSHAVTADNCYEASGAVPHRWLHVGVQTWQASPRRTANGERLLRRKCRPRLPACAQRGLGPCHTTRGRGAPLRSAF